MKLKKVALFIVFILVVTLAKNVKATDNSYYTVDTGTPVKTNQLTEQYSAFTYRSKTFLFDNGDNTLSKVDILDTDKSNQYIKISKLNSSYQKISENTVSGELSLIGGVYIGSEYNYIAYGQNNLNDDDNVEVIRVVKYSKNWSRISQCSLKAINTYKPFEAGECRFAEKDGNLIIYTCHEMYKSSDGYHHQANLMIEIRESDMNCLYTKHEVKWTAVGYVSHSFDQYAVVDGNNLYTADHGDAYPRGIELNKYDFSNLTKPINYATPFVVTGSIGDNYTGMHIGGLEVSDNNCLIVGHSVRQIDDGKNNSEKRNIFLSITPKNNVSSSSAKTIWLTNNDYSGNLNVTIPKIVKINNNRFLIMWQLDGKNNYGKVQMILVDGNGNKITDVITFGGMLSKCKPILFNNKVVWYSATQTIGKTIYFSLDVSTDQKVRDYNNKNLINYDDVKDFDITENSEGGFILNSYNDSKENVILPYYDYPWLMMGIRAGAFKTCTNVKNVTISGDYKLYTSKTATGIFQECSSLQSVRYLPGAKKINNSDFYGCTSLTNVELSNTIETIGENAFYKAGLTSLTLSDSITEIGKYAFSNNTNLSSINFSNNLKTIGDFAFAYNKSLKSIDLPKNLETIGKYAFYSGNNIEGTIKIPSKVTSIGYSAFEGNRKIEKIIFEKSNVTVGDRMAINDHEMFEGDTYKPIEGVKISKVEPSKEGYVSISSDGTITALKAGNSITVSYYVEGQEKFVFSTVLTIKKSIKLTDVSINKNSLKLKTGETDKIDLTYAPANTTEDVTQTWSSSNPAVVTVDNEGNVSAKGYGQAKITVKCGSFTKECEVEVREAYFVNKFITLPKSTIYVVELGQYDAELDNGSTAKVDLTANNDNVEIYGNNIIGIKAGFTTITAFDERYGDLTYVTFVNDSVMLSDRNYKFPGDLNGNNQFDEEDITLLTEIIKKGDLSQDNKKICDINGDGIFDESDIKVLDAIVNDKSMKIDEIAINSIDIMTFEEEIDGKITYSLYGLVRPDNTTMDKTLTYTSSDTETATIDERGDITVLKAGKVTFTITTVNGIKQTYTKTFTDDDITNKVKYTLGDINEDGKVNSKDAKLALQAYTGKITLTESQQLAGDVNRDNKINSKDAKLILQYYTGKITNF